MNTSSEYKEFTNSSVTDFYQLLKPRVMSLVVFSGFIGMLVAPGEIHPFIAFVSILMIALGSGASGAINMWYDRDIDAVMKRTQKRPIPDGRMNENEALWFGVIMAIASVVIMAIAANPVAAAVLAAAILFYVFIYTMWLKRRTPQNIVIGGAAGAFPPMIGWATVTGDITLDPIILFAIIFFWTPPHFWALSLLIKDEYKDAAVPMLPVVSGVKVTKINIFVYTIILAPVAALPYFTGLVGEFYLATSSILSLMFIYYAIRILRDDSNIYARKTFLFSIIYLFALYTFLAIDNLFIN